ncbi:MAG: hypothetical protein IPJ02_15595 [Chitinophagaceae bacterium]|nr:hypothetical protein [Chitinophagaceae bacterium]
MKYLIDIAPKQAQTIQKYLDNGNYTSLSQFVSTAIENQLSLEENDMEGMVAYKPETLNKTISNTGAVIVPGSFEKYSLKNIPEYNEVINAPEFKNLVFASQNIPEDQAWIWGQINKIFPVKVGVRILHQLLATRQSIELNEFLDIVAKEATNIAEMLRGHETKNGRMRGEKTSPGLPSADEKSQSRYKFQFMVYLRKDGLMDGAMSLMKFCSVYEERKKQMIGITEAGLKFSAISNPVLDENDFDLSLGKEESLFYINHIKENVKGEYAAIKWMLEKVNTEKTTRELLNTEIEKTYGKVWSATDAIINTQRAGITARMFELGLIEKEKDGIYVKYRVSEIGKKLISK